MEKYIKIILLIIGILLLLNVLMLFSILGFRTAFILQGGVAISFIIYAIFLNRIPKEIHIIAGILAFIPIAFASFLGIYGNANNADYNEDVVIVLGAAVHGDQVSIHLARRLDAAIEYHRQNPDAMIIVCGGQGPGDIMTEALAMERYLIERGVPQDRIIQEDMSTSTYENLYFAKGILDEYFPDGFQAVLITNDFHIFRAVSMASRMGMFVNHIGAYTEWYTLPVHYLREMAAVVNMWIFL